jgi:putative ABC transport system permease protein
VNLLSLSARNALRNPFRSTLTVVGVAVTILAFVLLRTVVWAYSVGAEAAAKDRVVTRHKVTFILTLPKRYVDTVREEPGVTQVTFANWFGGKDPKHDKEFFATLAVDPETNFEVYDEMRVPQADLAAWKADRQGAIVGSVLAKKLGWKVGDKVTLQSQFIPGDFEFTIRGIYTATRKSVDQSTFFFHWARYNEVVPARQKDQVGWIVSRISDASKTAELGAALDRRFDEKDVQTLSMSEGAFNASFLGMFSAVLRAIDIVSVVILGIMMLILGNTIAMSVRERTKEYGTLRAIGFLPKHLAIFVLGEAITVGTLGGALGLLLSYPIVELGMGRFLEENMGSMFPYFRVTGGTAAVAMTLAIAMSALAGAVPAISASRLGVVESLRRIA